MEGRVEEEEEEEEFILICLLWIQGVLKCTF